MPIDSRLPRIQGVAIAPGTQMHLAMCAKDRRAQQAIFNDCERTRAKLEGRTIYRNFDGGLVEIK